MNATTKQDDVEALKSEFESLRADVASLAESLQQFLNQQSARTGHATEEEEGEPPLDEALKEEWEALRERLDAARAGGEQAVRELRSEVEQHPLASIGIALGLGYLLGKLLK